MDKTLKIAVLLSAVDNMSSIIGSAVGKSETELKKLKAASADIAKGTAQFAAGYEIAQTMRPAVDAAATFESKMADVRKVVNGLNDPKALAAFGQEINQLGREIGIPTEQLIDLAAAGGRMDVPKNELIGYVREVSKMSVAFDMAAGEVGETMGKITKMFDMPISKVSELGDVINYLDDNAIAKGSDIMEVMLRTAGTAKQIGMTNQNLAALSSTFLTLGSRPEVAGTAINALMRELSIAEMQPKRFQDGLEQLGISASTLQKSMKFDPQGTIMQVLEQIKKNPNGVMLSTQLFGKEYGDDIAKLAGGLQEYRRQLGLANSASASGSMGREFEIRNKTFNAEVQKMSNAWTEIKVNLGSAILPSLKDILGVIRPIASAVSDWFANNPEMAKFIGMAVTLAGGFLMLSGAISIIRGVIGVMRLLNITMWMNPVMLIAGLFILAISLIYAYWEPISNWFKNMWAKVKSAFLSFWNWVKNIILNYTPQGLIYKHWDSIAAWFKSMWEGVKMVFNEFMDWVINWPKKLLAVGEAIVDNIKAGIEAKWDQFKDWFKDKLQGLRDFLPFSPAKTGPLKDIHRLKFVETIAGSIKPGPLVRAVHGVTAAAALAFASPAAANLPMGSSAGGGMVVNINVPVHIAAGGIGNPDDISAAVRKMAPEIVREIERINARKKARSY